MSVIGVGVDITEGRRLQQELEAIQGRHMPMIVRSLPDDVALILTCREWDVLHLIAAGKTNREIALALSISTKTVEKHINSLYTKLGVHSRVDMSTWVLHHATSAPPDLPQR